MNTFIDTSPVCFVLVHGARPHRHLTLESKVSDRLFDGNRWYIEGSALLNELNSSFPKRNVELFDWIGKNTQKCRYNAAAELAVKLCKLNKRFDNIVVIGHSHGGNVSLMAAQMAKLAGISIVTLGTPFIKSSKINAIARFGMIYLSIMLILMTSISFSLIYFGMAWLGLLYFFVHGLVLAVSLVRFHAHERLACLFKTKIEKTASYFKYSTVISYIRMLCIRYDTDTVLHWSEALAAVERLGRNRLPDEVRTLEKHDRFLSFIAPSICFGISVLIAWVLARLGAKIYALYLILTSLCLFTIYLFFATLFVGFYVRRIFAHQFQKIYKFPIISSLSLRENLYVSSRTQYLPVIENDAALIRIVDLPAPGAVKNSHSDICHEPLAIAEIIRWIKNSDTARI